MPSLNIGDLYVSIGTRLEGLEKGVKDATKQFDNLMEHFKTGQKESFGVVEGLAQRAGQAFGAITNPAVMATAAVTGLGVAAVNGVKSSVQLAASLEDAMANVSTLVDPAVVNLDEMQRAIVGMSTKTNKSAVDLANGLYQVISAGVPAADAVSFLEVSAKAATSGMTDTFTAVDGLSTVLNAFGLKASEVGKIADQMFQTVNLGKTTFPELASAIGQVAPTAAALGLSTNELFAAIAELTKQGLGTSEAITGIKAALSNVIKPSTDAEKIAKALGISFDAAALKSKGLTGFLSEVGQAMQGLQDPAKRAEAVQRSLFTSFGFTGNLEQAISMIDSAKDSGKKLPQGFADMVGFWDEVEKSGGNVQAVLAGLFGSVEALNSVLALTSQAGSADLVNVLGQMEGSAGAVETAFDKQTGTLNAMSEKFRLSLEAIGLTVGDKLLPILEKFLGWVNDNMPAIQSVVSGALDVIVAGFTGVGDFIQQTMPLWESIGTAIKAIADTGFTALKVAVDGIGTALQLIVQVLSGDWKGAWETASGFVGQTMESILGLVQRNIDALLKVLHINVNLKGIQEWVSGVISSIGGLPDEVSTKLDALANRIRDKFVAIKDANIQRIQELWNGVVAAFEPQRLLDAITNAFKGTLEYLQNTVPKAFVQGGINIINAFLQGLMDAAKKVPIVGNKIADFLGQYLIGQSPPPKGPLSEIDDGGRNVIEAWVQGMLSGLPSIEGVGPVLADRVAKYLLAGLPGGPKEDTPNAGPSRLQSTATGWMQGIQQLDLFGEVLAKINPAAELLAGFLDGIAPALEALTEPLQIIGRVVGTILAPVFKIFEPILKNVAIVFTKVGIAIGEVWNKLVWLIDQIPFVDMSGWYIDVESMRKSLKELESGTNKAAESMGNFNIPQGFKVALERFSAAQGIPAMANGGIVTRPTVALIGEAGPEAVVPLSRGGGMGAGVSVNLTIQGNVYADDLERRVVEAVSRATRRQGLARHGLAGARA